MVRWWNLPGPSAFVQSICDDLRTGKNVILQASEILPDGLWSMVRSILATDGVGTREIELPIEGEYDPLVLLYDRFMEDYDVATPRSMRDFVSQPALEGLAALLQVKSHQSWSIWRSFIQQYQVAQREVRPTRRFVLFAVVVGKLSDLQVVDDVCTVVRRWDNSVSRYDIQFYADSLIHGRVPESVLKHLIVSTITQMALWNVEVANHLAQLPIEEILFPYEELRALGRRLGCSFGDTAIEASWVKGTAGVWEGRRTIHPILSCSHGDIHSYHQRLWFAQAPVLLPFLEVARHELLTDLGPRIPLPYRFHGDTVISDLLDLEIGHIAHLCTTGALRVDRKVGTKIELMRAARNSLAHFEPLPKNLLLSCAFQNLLLEVEKS